MVSSDWKNWATVEEMGEYYEQQGIIKKPIDFTPMTYTLPETQEWHPDWDLEASRTLEIKEWLDNNSVTNYVVLDDQVKDIVDEVDNVIKVDSQNGFEEVDLVLDILL